MICQKCGRPLNTGAVFCTNCGTRIRYSENQKVTAQKVANGFPPNKKKSRDLKALFLGFGIGAAIVAIIFLAVQLVLPPSDTTGKMQTLPNRKTDEMAAEDTSRSQLEQGIKEKSVTAEDAATLYHDYFWREFSENDMVCLADVTHDGVADMIVVDFLDEDTSTRMGYVFTIDSKKEVRQIYSRVGSEYHMGYGGFFNWFIKPSGKYYNLGAEEGDMAMNHGTKTFHEFYLDNNGRIIDVTSKTISSEDFPEPLPMDEFNAAYDEYDAFLKESLKSFYILYDALRYYNTDEERFPMDSQTAFIVN